METIIGESLDAIGLARCTDVVARDDLTLELSDRSDDDHLRRLGIAPHGTGCAGGPGLCERS